MGFHAAEGILLGGGSSSKALMLRRCKVEDAGRRIASGNRRVLQAGQGLGQRVLRGPSCSIGKTAGQEAWLEQEGRIRRVYVVGSRGSSGDGIGGCGAAFILLLLLLLVERVQSGRLQSAQGRR